VVFWTGVSTEAHLIQGLLESEGIAAEVRDEVPMVYAATPATPEYLPSVWVAAADAARADAIVRDFLGGRVQKGEAWRCPGCGETMDAQFTACWHCGRSRAQKPGA